MRVIERSFSDLLRHPGDVTGELERGDVLLRRRDEPDLRLTRADREEARTIAFDTAARAFRSIAVQHPEALTDALADMFPWVEFLPAHDLRVFADEFGRVAAGGSALDNYIPLVQLINEWRASAEILADPELARHLSEPITAVGASIKPPA